MIPELSWTIIAFCGFIYLLGGFITGFSGFGFALIAVPLLLLVLDLKFAVPAVLLAGTFAVVVLSFNKLRFFKEPMIVLLAVTMAIGTVAGTYILKNAGTGYLTALDTNVLRRILGVLIILFSFQMFFQVRQHESLRFQGPIGCVAGVLSGVLGGVFGTSGPPLVIYAHHFAEDKSTFRAQLLVLFVVHNVFRIFLYAHSSLINLNVLKFNLVLLPPLIIGLVVGSHMHFQVNETTFNRAISLMLCISGILLLVK